MTSLSPDILYKSLLIAFFILSVMSMVIFWRASLKIKIIMVFFTFIELGIVIFISLILFKETSLTRNSLSHEIAEEISKDVDVLKSDVKSFKEASNKHASASKLFLTAESFKKEYQYQDALYYYQECLKDIKDPKLEAELYYKIGDIKRVTNDTKEALSYFQKALNLFTTQKDILGVGHVLNRVGRTEYQLSNFDLSLKAYDQALAIFTKLQNKKYMASCLHGLGNTFFMKGDLEKALVQFKEAKKLFLEEEMTDNKGYAHVLLKEADVHITFGNYKEANSLLKTAIDIFHNINDRQGEGCALIGLGKLSCECSKYEKGMVYLEKANTIFEKIGDSRLQGFCTQYIAEIALRRGNTLIALEKAQQSYDLFLKASDRRNMARSLVIKTQTLIMSDKSSDALNSVNTALKIFQEIKSELLLGEAHYVKGWCLQILENNEISKTHLNKALEIFKKFRIAKWEGIVALGLGTLHEQIGHYEEAHDYFYTALKVFKNLDNTYWDARTLTALACLETLLHNFQRAASLVEEAQTKAQVSDDTFSQGVLLYTQAKISYHMGNYIQAQVLLDQANHIFEKIGYRKGIAKILCQKLQIHIMQGDYESAEVLLPKIFEILKSRKDFFVEIEALGLEAYLLQRKGKIRESQELCKKILDKIATKNIFIIFCKNLKNLAESYLLLGEFEKAEETLNRGKSIIDDHKNTSWHAKYLITFGKIYLRRGEFSQAESCFEKALQTFKQYHLKHWQGVAHLQIGLTNYNLGDFEKAEYHLEKAQTIFKDLGVRSNSTKTLAGLGLIYVRKGKFNQAVSLFNEALILTQRTKDLIDENYVRMAFADLKRSIEPPETTKKYYEDTLSSTRLIGDAIGTAYGLSGLGYLETKYGSRDEGKKLLLQAYNIFTRAYYVTGIIKISRYLGDFYTDERKYDKAQEQFDYALEISKKHNIMQSRGDIFRRLGYIYYKKKELEKSLRYYEKALACSHQYEHRRNEARILRHLAKVHATVFNEYSYPREILGKALRQFKENNDFLLEIDTLIKIGGLEQQFNNTEEALEAFVDALKISQHAGDKKSQIRILGKIAKLYIETKQYGIAQKNLEKCLDYAKDKRDKLLEIKALKRLGLLFKAQGKKENPYFLKALEIAQEIKDVFQQEKIRKAQFSDI